MSNDLILAAGGVVEKDTPDGLRIAVVYRTRYGGEWGLPKGKVKQGESVRAAAEREVLEETGCPVRTVGFAGSTSYCHGDSPKVVMYWRMSVVGECAGPSDAKEVQKVDWLSPGQALKRLSHRDEANLLVRVYDRESPALGRLQRLLGALCRVCQWKRWHRLASELRAFRTELSYRGCREGRLQPTPCWLSAAEKAVSDAERALDAGDIHTGWVQFHTARRLALFGLGTDELSDRAIATRKEAAAKLASWRRDAVEALLCDVDERIPSPDTLYVAAMLLDEHYCNEAYKDGLARSHFLRLAIVLTVVLVLIVRMLLIHRPWTESQYIVGVILFGLLGGTLSAIFTGSPSGRGSRIPEVMTACRMMIIRLFVSAASALVVYMVIRAGIVVVLNEKMCEEYGILAAAFAAGFTERLVLRAVEQIAGPSSRSSPA